MSPIIHCFPELTVTLDVELISGRFIMLVFAAMFVCVLRMYIMHDCLIALYGFKTLHSPSNTLLFPSLFNQCLLFLTRNMKDIAPEVSFKFHPPINLWHISDIIKYLISVQ